MAPPTSKPALPSPLPTPSTLDQPSFSSLNDAYIPLLEHLQSPGGDAGARKTPGALASASAGKRPLLELDALRHDVLPARVEERRKEGRKGREQGWLEMEEVRGLVEWKL